MICATMAALQNDSELRAKFGARIKALRVERNLSQKELAGMLGIRNTHLYKYEAGIHAPPLEKLAELADAFGVSIDYLVTGKQPEHQPIKNTRLAQRFEALEQFPPKEQETVITLIDAMVAKQMIAGAASPFEMQR